jgi:hypothetical protein
MTLYNLCEWEINGYDDSDFMMSAFNDETNKIETICVGSTRYAGGYDYRGAIMPTVEIVEKARLVLAEYIFQSIRAAEHRDVLEPDDVAEGVRVSLIEAHKNQTFKTTSCTKCNGSGHWVNPKNSADKRECFACKGYGELQGEKVKDANGKLVWEKFSIGLSGVVKYCGAYGTFYRNGYNQPGRHNRTVKFVTDEGKLVKAPLSKLRLAREPMTDEKLRERAESLSHDLHFGRMYPKCAWYDKHFAADVVAKAKEANTHDSEVC